ncbi:MAG: plasmid maintenance system antidote protein VapI [Bacteroidia bacterium]
MTLHLLNMENVNTRVLRVMVHFNLGKSAFAKSLEVSPVMISHISSGRNKVGLELIQKLILEYPEVSPLWLLTGKGRMLDDGSANRMKEFQENLDALNADIKSLDAGFEIVKRKMLSLTNLASD